MCSIWCLVRTIMSRTVLSAFLFYEFLRAKTCWNFGLFYASLFFSAIVLACVCYTVFGSGLSYSIGIFFYLFFPFTEDFQCLIWVCSQSSSCSGRTVSSLGTQYWCVGRSLLRICTVSGRCLLHSELPFWLSSFLALGDGHF